MFFNKQSNNTTNNNSTPKREKTDEEKAFDYFGNERIRCESKTDKDTVTFIYKSLKVKNHDTSDEEDMEDGLQTLDNNVYYFAQAVFYQNFMLMRKIDALSDRIRILENKSNRSI